jgi:large subunit ribosomal protein L35
MPKMKTNRAAAKRFKITAKGKIKRRRANLRHILVNRTRKRKRRLGKPTLVDKTNERAIKALLPYGVS